MITMSSTQSPNLCSVLPTKTPEILGEDLISVGRGSMPRENISGDDGHPWRVQLDYMKGSGEET